MSGRTDLFSGVPTPKDGGALNTPSFDIRSIPKIESFTGRDEEWPDWKFQAKAYFMVAGLGPSLKMLEDLEEPPDLIDTRADVEEQAHFLYNVLCMTLEGKKQGTCEAV